METFQIEGKVGVITGAATGIGLCMARQLLQNGIKGLTLIDINDVAGQNALKTLKTDFGSDRVIFVVADTTDKTQFEDAFKCTIRTFGNVDILINNAGVLNDIQWEKQIDVNIKGTVNGVLLGLEHYIKEYKSGSEGIIVNISSIAAFEPEPLFPMYTATKYAILGLGQSYGLDCHYKRTNVKVVTVCPGFTKTGLNRDPSKSIYSKQYLQMPLKRLRPQSQPSEHVGESMVHIIQNGSSGSVWIIEASNPPYEVVMPRKDECRKM